ncbi:hypothetical protein IV203_020986 [Nitzschia inconspicua]|uniref:Uncharacterized protein n=1 Tax=Nitzschia inconspicua TaxID=303405 RepID=A0A9K3KGR0_9STRA|nr:hypothetical protein IV203_020986 [Nitzschia inconspicua]
MNLDGGHRNMAIFDRWHADEDPCQHPKPQELHFDVLYWPQPSESKCYTLRLEELTHYGIQDRLKARVRNMERIQFAHRRNDVVHLHIHYTCCVDQIQRVALEELVQRGDREWCSFTMIGINGLGDLYTSPNATTESLFTLFMALQNFQILNLYSSTLNRGHGLECILKAIPYYEKLKVLRLEGWQMDRVTATALIESLRYQHRKTISYLSIRSCRFLGEGTFLHVVDGLRQINQLRTLNVSYCNLADNEIISFVLALEQHPKMTNVHLGGNCCYSQESVQTIASWIRRPSCRLSDLNLRSLWVGFSEEGLLQRLVDLEPLFNAISENESICHLSLPENYLEDDEIVKLTSSLSARSQKNLRFLDVGDNPFEEKGAMLLADLVQRFCSIQAIRFENHFMHYQCSELVKLLAEFNGFRHWLLDERVNISLSVWPYALEKVQQRKDNDDGDNHPTQQRAANHLFRMLRSATGPYGHELSIQIAIHNLSK